MTKNASPFACVMEAIEPAQREAHIATAKSLFGRVTEVRELENGYSFCFGSDATVLTLLADFVTLEKLCCPFFGFIIRIEPEGGDILLDLTGRDGVKPFIQVEIGEIVGTQIVPIH